MLFKQSNNSMVQNMKYQGAVLWKNISAVIPVFIIVFMISCSQAKQIGLMSEPVDPATYDMLAWNKIEAGIHSGFGSIDIADSKSIPPPGQISASIFLQGWKGERVNCKLLIWSASNKENICIKTSDFSNNHNKIDKKSTSISAIRFVLTDQFLNESGSSCGLRDKDKVSQHISPEMLTNENCFTLGANGTRPVWISIDIPADAVAGIYNGSVSILSASGIKNHTITIEVINKRLPPPSEWSFHLDLWQNPFAVARYHKVKLWSKKHIDLLRPLLTKLAESGQKCITTTLIDRPGNGKVGYEDFGSMIDWVKKKDGRWIFNYTAFDQYVKLAMDCGIKEQINCYSMVPVGNTFSWFDETKSEKISMELIPGTKAYENILRGFLIDFKKHLNEKGWLNITSLALDEREEEEMSNFFRFLKETAPELKITMAGFYYQSINPLIYDFSSNWRYIDTVSGKVLENRKSQGLKTTYYVACGITQPNNFTFSPPAESCYEGWFAAAKGFDGFLRWAYNSWPEDPVIDSRYIKWPSGDTYLMYPGAHSSIRFERLREGIQDYEKIKIIRKELHENRSAEAVIAEKKLNDFLNSINKTTLNNRTAAEVINEGKKVLYEISRSVFDAYTLLQIHKENKLITQ